MSGVRTSRNPEGGYSRPILIDGVEYEGAVGSEQETEQDIPSKPLEDGAEVGQRNVVHPEEGSVMISATSAEVGQLRDLATQRDPINITTAEGAVSDVVVERVERNVDNRFDDKFDVTVHWRQVQIADVGEGSIVALTDDGQASGSSDDETPSEVVGGDERETSDGPEPSFWEEALSPALDIGEDIADFF
jgi:hypothetical protein